MTPETQTSATADDPTQTADPGLPTALERERDDLRDRLLRTTAEFDNYRKRTDRERRDLHEAAATDIIRDVLPIVDDLERALAAAAPEARAEAGPVAAFRQGVDLIHRQMLEVLRRRGVEALDVVGQPFDPNWHEAVGHEPADGRPDGEIVTEVRRGYRLGERLLRAAMVRVARA
ncbi:MAG TPA: nucleotide exchange factor GrpE [Vicinamibacterales bacterium]|nr:nucleotide exchange factor GrpE [Vicinamibacterales bacterium]